MKPAILIVGLGNIGNEYTNTRHNVGFEAVDILKEQFGHSDWKAAAKFKADIAEARLHSLPVLLVKPTTYMNRSGESVSKLVDFYKLEPKQVLFVFDDIDIPLGEVRFRNEGSGGTHNGAKSVLDSLGTQAVPRVRLGIGPKPQVQDLASWVLSRFTPAERSIIEDVLCSLPNSIEQFVFESTN